MQTRRSFFRAVGGVVAGLVGGISSLGVGMFAPQRQRRNWTTYHRLTEEEASKKIKQQLDDYAVQQKWFRVAGTDDPPLYYPEGSPSVFNWKSMDQLREEYEILPVQPNTIGNLDA